MNSFLIFLMIAFFAAIILYSITVFVNIRTKYLVPLQIAYLFLLVVVLIGLGYVAIGGILIPRLVRVGIVPTTLIDSLPALSSASEYIRRGDRYKERGELSQAAKDYTQATLYDPSSIEAHMKLGHLYFSTEEYSKAIAHFSEVLEIDNKFAEAYLYPLVSPK